MRCNGLVLILPLGAALVLASCGDQAMPVATLEVRAPDGLLSDPELQAVVEAQVDRDATALISWLGHERAEVRARAAFALASVQDPRAVPALARAARDPNAAVRRDVALALGQTGATSAVRLLAGIIAMEDDRAVRRTALEALGRIPHASAAASLLMLAVEGDEEVVRTRSLARLAAVGGVTSKPILAHLLLHLEHTDPRIRDAAAYFFGRSREPELWAESADVVRGVLARSDPGSEAELFLLAALGRLADPADGGLLRKALRSSDWRARTNAAQGLVGRAWTAETGTALLEALDDPSLHVAISAGQAVASSAEGAEVLEQLEAWVEANPDRWQVVAPLLGQLARQGRAGFVVAWTAELAADDELRWRAGLAALAEARSSEAREVILHTMETAPPAVASAAADALAQRWSWERDDPGSRALYLRTFASALTDEDRSWTFPAARVLADSLFLPAGVDSLMAAHARWSEAGQARRRRAVEFALTAGGYEDRLPPGGEGGGEDPGAGEEQAVSPVADAARMNWPYLSSLGTAPALTLETEKGRVVVRLATEEAPQTVQTIARFAEEGRYDGVIFHRVVPNFVVQGGDFSGPDGSGGPDFSIRSEFGTIPHDRGVIGMASAGKDTEGSQFFISHSPQPHLDGSYTTFGWVVEGMDVVDGLQVGDRILRASVQPGG